MLWCHYQGNGKIKSELKGAVPEDLFSWQCFRVLSQFKNKFDRLVKEMLYIKQLRLPLNVQTDSIRTQVFFYLCSFMQIQSTLTPFELAFLLLHSLIMASWCRRKVSHYVKLLQNRNYFSIYTLQSDHSGNILHVYVSLSLFFSKPTKMLKSV